MTKEGFKTVGATIRIEDLDILNSRLQTFGFNSTGEMIQAFIKGKFPPTVEDLRDNFIDNVNADKMLEFYLKNKKYTERYSKALVSYFRRYRQVFFSENAEQLLEFAPHKRGWILDSMRNFADYAFKEYGTEDFENDVNKIIKRYQLNRNLDRKQKIFIVDDDYIKTKLGLINEIIKTGGKLGTLVNFGLKSGIRQDEIIYSYEKPICPNNFGCKCDKIHVVVKGELSLIFLNWFRARKKAYFYIIPTALFTWLKQEKPALSDLNQAHLLLKANAGIKYMDLRKLNYNIMINFMAPVAVDVLAGRAKTVSAQHYALYELDKMAEKYKQAWNSTG